MFKVLFISRPTLFSAPGGDTIQMELTKKFLEKEHDVKVEILEGSNFKSEEFDLIHFFNITRPNNILPYVNLGLPYVVSPIYVDYSEFDQHVRGGLFGKIASTLGKNQTEYV